ncbi:GTA-gp10 family protein [Sinorhizobium fredii]|uniref:GTA-gp10 family protein n=1 Tax=Rhizobium fredii TaxID=380 RepID=UPI00056D8C72|nr:GTA-gp10 family protein [Sinorhizobium fredii]
MANPNRGSVALQVGDRAYTLSFSINALCELEDLLDKPVAAIVEAIQKPTELRMSSVRAIIWAGLQDHHEGLSVKEAGQIASEAGTQAALAKVGEAFRLAFPQPTQGGAKANPRKAKG